MIKNFKFSGIVLLVAGLSFAAASCTKQAPETTPVAEETIELNSVNFSELTKAPQEALAVSTDSVQIAIEEILKNLEKELKLAGEAHAAAVDSAHVVLFRAFTSFFGYHRFDRFKFVDGIGFIKAIYQLNIGREKGDENVCSYIRFGRRSGVFSLETLSGYFVKVRLPGWGVGIEEYDWNFHTFSVSKSGYEIVIGKNETVYSVTYANRKEVRTDIYDLNNNDYIVAGSVWIDDEDEKNDYIWYNNEGLAGNNPTSFKIYDLETLDRNLKCMKAEFTSTEAEAWSVVKEFNDNVQSCGGTEAILCGKPFVAVVDGPTPAKLYRAIIKWDEKFVPAEEIYTLIEEWLKKVLSEK